MVSELWVPTMGNQDSTGYLDIQLSVVRTMPSYGATLVVFSCGAVVSVIRALWLVLVQCQGC